VTGLAGTADKETTRTTRVLTRVPSVTEASAIDSDGGVVGEYVAT
jgi:hypothetical protein